MRRRFFTELNTNKYFSIELLEDGNIIVCNIDIIDNQYNYLLKYSKNNISNWEPIKSIISNGLGDIIYFKCAKWEVESLVISVESPCKIKGNPLSLCGYIPNTNTNFSSFLSRINVVEIDDSFWYNISMNYDLYIGLFASNYYITSISIPDYITKIPSNFFFKLYKSYRHYYSQ